MADGRTGRLTAAGRWLTMTSPLGEDVLIPTGFRGTEAISRLFNYNATVLSSELDIRPQALLGKPVTVTHVESSDRPRHFSGIVEGFTALGINDRDYRLYELEIVPALWLSTLRHDSRIFQWKSVVDIIKEVLGAYQGLSFEIGGLKGDYQTHEYRVQYRESDFAFVSRLMEEEGLWYYFTHHPGAHQLVIGDGPNAWAELGSADQPIQVRSQDTLETIKDWAESYQFTTQRWSYRDYDFKKPKADLTVGADTTLELSPEVGVATPYEAYDYPGRYSEVAHGDQLSRVRIQEDDSDAKVISGESMRREFLPGASIHVAGAGPNSGSSEFVLTEVSHFLSSPTAVTGALGEQQDYRNSFRAVAADVAERWRPARRTSRPRIPGPQTAVVVGPKSGGDKEIHVDEFGRIKVRFHWDRAANAPESASCWIRVGQAWAGERWGLQFIPRVGMEVIVSFLEGDPDRPLVTGAVYNADNMPTFDPVNEKTRSGIRTRSTPDASVTDVNEVRFEDKAGEEEIYIHGQRDLEVRVERERHDHVLADHHERIAGARFQLIQDDVDVTIGGRRQTEIEESDLMAVGQDLSRDVDGSVYVRSGAAIHLMAQSEIQLRVGSSFIRLTSSGISIEGPRVNINCGGSASRPQMPDVEPSAPREVKDTRAGLNPGNGGSGGGPRRPGPRLAGIAGPNSEAGSISDPGQLSKVAQRETSLVDASRFGAPLVGMWA